MDKKEIGKKGEKIAVEYLKENGYEIIELNHQKREGEIDIIAQDPEFNEIVFVEVKARSSNAFGYPEESVDNKKIDKIITVANKWMEENNKEEQFSRIDIIAIELNTSPPAINHIKNITL